MKIVAAPLRQPSGEHALTIAKKMNEGNKLANLNAIDALKLKNKDTVLEVGMGNGFFVPDILK